MYNWVLATSIQAGDRLKGVLGIINGLVPTEMTVTLQQMADTSGRTFHKIPSSIIVTRSWFSSGPEKTCPD